MNMADSFHDNDNDLKYQINGDCQVCESSGGAACKGPPWSNDAPACPGLRDPESEYF